MKWRLPGFEEIRVGTMVAHARPEARAWVEAVLERRTTLFEASGQQPNPIRLEGRGAVHVVTTSAGVWVVRRYRRGGGMRSLGDRYIRAGTPRPVLETLASDSALARGIPTPRVVASAIYPSGIFYRADLVTEYCAGTRDLGAVLFVDELLPERRRLALETAGRLLFATAQAGVQHPDMNAKNILVGPHGLDSAVLLDLDRVRVTSPARPVDPAPMLARLERSLWKLGEQSGKALSASEWLALRQAVQP